MYMIVDGCFIQMRDRLVLEKEKRYIDTYMYTYIDTQIMGRSLRRTLEDLTKPGVKEDVEQRKILDFMTLERELLFGTSNWVTDFSIFS